MTSTFPPVDLIGFAHTPFVRRSGDDVEALMATAASEALASAGLAGRDIDQVVIGHFNPGLVRQGFTAGLSAQLAPGLRMVPAVRVENACATGSAAVHHAATLIEAGRARRVLVIGVEVMSEVDTAAVGNALLQAAYAREEADVPAGFAGMFSRVAEAYAQRFGNPRRAMSQIAVKNHANGRHNPYAQLRTPLAMDEALQASPRNPAVTPLLLRSDCSPISDGAAALVMVRGDQRPSGTPAVRLRARAQANDLLPMSQRDMSELAGARVAWQRLLDDGRLSLGDLAFVEVHDCFTIAELMLYEALGLAAPGEGGSVLDDGTVRPEGRLPVNLSGGLKAKGHPVGATGVSMHVMTAWQLLGRWRHPDAGAAYARSPLAALLNMGGAGVANYGSVLERLA
jgi:acetyl-CoA C-acetyltransferase